MLGSAFFENSLILLLVVALWVTFGLNVWLWKRWDAPSTIFALVWALIGTVHYFTEGLLFFAVHATTVGYLFAAVFAFSLGALFSVRQSLPNATERVAVPWSLSQSRQRVLFFFVLLLAITLPAYVNQALDGVSVDEPAYLLAALRNKSLEGAEEGKSFSLLRNLQLVSMVVAVSLPLVATKNNPMWFTRVAAIIIAVVHGLSTGSKAVLPSLLVCLVIVHYGLRPGKFSIPRLTLLTILGLGLFLVALRFTAFAYVEASWIEILPTLAEALLTYITSPLIGLDNALRDPMSVVVAGQHPWRSVQFVQNGLFSTFGIGGPEEIPRKHASFFQPGPNLTDGYNTYTFLISYHLMGGPGAVFAWTMFLGFALTTAFNQVSPAKVTLSAYYSLLASLLVFSFNGDSFLLDAPNLIKMFAICVTINTVLPRLFVTRIQL